MNALEEHFVRSLVSHIRLFGMYFLWMVGVKNVNDDGDGNVATQSGNDMDQKANIRDTSGTWYWHPHNHRDSSL